MHARIASFEGGDDERLRQMNEELEKGSQAVKDKMQSAIKLAGQIERDAQKLNQKLLDKNTLSFDEKKQIDDLLRFRSEMRRLRS